MTSYKPDYVNTKDNDNDEELCLHEESENGVCNECGSEIDWVRRLLRET